MPSLGLDPIMDPSSKMSKMVQSERSLDQSSVEFDTSRFPTIGIIIWVKSLLIKRLPIELVELVLDHAEYWPHTTTVRPRLGRLHTPVKWRDTSSEIHSSSWPSPESKAMPEVLGFTLYSPPLASESSHTRAATLKKGLRRVVLRDVEMSLPPRGQHPARMIVFEAVSQRYDIQTGKFCDIGIVREDDLLEQDVPETGSQRRNSSVFSSLQSSTKPSKPAKSAKPDKTQTHHLAAQRECWFSPGAKAGGKFVIKWRHDEDLEDEGKGGSDETILPTTASFIKKMKVGDSIGLWAPVVSGNCIHKIDEVRMHVFWAV